MKKLIISIVLIGMLTLLSGCVYAPLEEDLYTQNIYPNDDNTYDIGSASLRYHDIYGYDGIFDYALINNNLNILNDVDIGNDLDVSGTTSSPVYTGQNIQVTGKVEADRLIGDIEGYSIDVVQASDLDIVLNDTLDLVFLFEPDVIVIDYSTRCLHDTTLEVGHTTGHSVITVTGVDTISYNTNMTALIDNNGAMGTVVFQNNAVNVIIAYGGNDGIDDANFLGVGTWDTGTHTLTLTFSTVANTVTGFNYVEIAATAYR